MSLLMDALRKAELQKQKLGSAPSAEPADETAAPATAIA